MTDTVCRRVPFTYHSLLYKLDNIHLKQTYRGKPFGRSTLRKVERLDNIGLDNTCTYNKDDKNDTDQGIKPVHNVQEDIILEPLLSDAIYNGYSNENHRVKLPISYDDDSDTASDLSIDGGSLSSDSHARVDNNRKTNTRDDQLGRVKELEIVKQKTQVSDGRHNDTFSSLTDGTDTHASSDRTPKTENIEDNPEIDKGNGRVISDVEGSHDRRENIVDYRDGDALDYNCGHGASVESNSCINDYQAISKPHTNYAGESAEDSDEYNDNVNESSKTNSDISHSFQDCLPLEDSLKSRNENNKLVIDVTHSDSPFIRNNLADERIHQKSSSFDKYDSMNIKEDTTSTPFESKCSPNHNLIDRNNGERSTIDSPEVHGNLADDEMHSMTREVYINQVTFDNVTETNDSATRKYGYDPETNDYVTREYDNDQATNDYVTREYNDQTTNDNFTREYDNDQPINENVTREYDNGLGTNDYVTREFDIHEATIDNVAKEYNIEHEKDDNVTREDNIDQAKNDYVTREYGNDQERDDIVGREDENDQETDDYKTREYDNDQPTNNDLPCSIQEHNSISSAKTGMDNFTKTRDDSIYQRGNDPLNLIDQHVSIKSMTAVRESNSSLNVTNNPENNNPTLTRSNRLSSSLPFRYRQSEHFVKEYDNSLGLISDLLNIGSSSKTTKSPLRKTDDRSVDKPMPQMTSYTENPISIPDRSNTIGNQSPQCNVTTSERYNDTNVSWNKPTRRIVYGEERMITDDEYNIPLVNKEASKHNDSDVGEIRNHPRESFSSSFPKRQKSQPNARDGLSRSVDQNRFRTDWSNISGKSKNTTEKIIETPLYKEKKEMNEISLATEENDSALKEIKYKGGESVAENENIFRKEDKQHLTQDKHTLGTTVDLQHVDKYSIAEERREDSRHFESETIDVAKQDTPPTSGPYENNSLDGDLHIESTDIVGNSVREEMLPKQDTTPTSGPYENNSLDGDLHIESTDIVGNSVREEILPKQDTPPTSGPYENNSLDGDMHIESTDIVGNSVREEILPKQDTTPTSGPYENNSLDGDLHIESTDIVGNSVREEILPKQDTTPTSGPYENNSLDGDLHIESTDIVGNSVREEILPKQDTTPTSGPYENNSLDGDLHIESTDIVGNSVREEILPKQDTTPTSGPYENNSLDGDLHIESTDIVGNSVREEILPSTNVVVDTDEKVILSSLENEEEKIEEAQSDSIKSQEEQNEIVPITIKRLSRPEKSKQGEDRKNTTANDSPFESLVFPGNSSVFSRMFGTKYSESTPKKIAETLANLPAYTDTDELKCPTCGQKVWGTDKTTNVIHQTLLKIPSLQTVATKYGLVVRNIAGDGDCMFSAVIDQLRIAGDFRFSKHSLRSTAVDYLREHPHQEDGSHLMCFLSTETWEEYLNRMHRSGEWGDHMILNAITEVIGRNVTVLSTSGNVTHLFSHHVPVSDDQNVDSVYLGHITDTHYCSLRPKDWEKIWSVNARMRRITIHLQSLEGKEDQQPDFLRSDDGVSDSESDQMETNDASDIIFMTNPSQIDDRTDILKSLAEDVHFVDPVSRIPVMHLSYILKQLLIVNYFMRDIKTVYSLSPNTDIEMDEIDSPELETKLKDFSKSRTERMSQTYSCRTSIAFPSRSTYTIIINELQVSSSPQVENAYTIPLLIDASETHPGYLRLKTINNTVCSNCQRVHSNRYISDIPVSLTCHNQPEMKYFTGVKCSCWPDQAHEWVTRHRACQWPRKDTIESILKNGCYIAHQNHPSSFKKEIEFQFVFSQAEKLLINEELTEDMKYCFYVFKALVEFQTKGLDCQIPTYLLQTTLFYACESIPPETFRNSCGGSVLFMIDLLLKWFRKRNLPNYFIKDNNMIDHWRWSDSNDISDKIETLRLFPCMVLHFISESHGLTHSWLIDSIMASAKRFKEDRNIHFVIENTFNPTTFCFANSRLISYRDYEGTLAELSEAFEKNLVWSGESVDFRKFLDEFLLTVNSQKAKIGFTNFIEEEFNINQAGSETEEKLQTSGIAKQSRFPTIGDFIGPEYKGMYMKSAFKSSGDPWDSIDMFITTVLYKQKYEEIADIAGCLIKKCQQDMESSVVDVSEIEDIELKKQIDKSNHDTTSKILERMISYYSLLGICYTYMGQIQLMSGVIDDYQEAVEKMPSKYHISNVANIWRELKCPEKAKEIEDNMQGLFRDDDEEDEFGKKFMAIFLDMLSYR